MSAIVGIFQTTPGHPSFCEIALLSQLPYLQLLGWSTSTCQFGNTRNTYYFGAKPNLTSVILSVTKLKLVGANFPISSPNQAPIDA